jgi:hypothetical protein
MNKPMKPTKIPMKKPITKTMQKPTVKPMAKTTRKPLKAVLPRFLLACNELMGADAGLLVVHTHKPFMLACLDVRKFEQNRVHFRCWPPEAREGVSRRDLQNTLKDMTEACLLNSDAPVSYKFDVNWKPPRFLEDMLI